MEYTENNRSSKLIQYSFMLAILVLCLHTVHILLPHFTKQDTSVDVVMHWLLTEYIYHITNLAVPSFFLISSYLFFRNYTISKTKKKFKNRLRTLLIPYLIWNLISLLWLIVVYNLPIASQFLMAGKTELSINYIAKVVFLSENNVLWFVGVLLIYNAFCWLFYALLKPKLGGALLLVAIFVWPLFDNMKILGLGWISPLVYGIGAFLGIHYSNIHDKTWKEGTVILSFILFVCITFADVILIPHPHTEAGSYIQHLMVVWLKLLEMLLLWIAFDILPARNKTFRFMGLSFFIYVIHRYVLKITSHLLLLITKQISSIAVSEAVTYLLTITLTLVVCIYIAKLWNLICPKSFALITGGRY